MSEESLATGGQDAGSQGQDAGDGAGGEAGTSTGFAESLPEALRGNEHLSSFENLEGLAQGYVDLRGKVPQVPESGDDYEITYPDGFPVNKDAITAFRKLAHESGMTQDMVNALINYNINSVQSRIDSTNKAQDDAVTELKGEWKEGYDANIAKVNKVVTFAGGEELEKLCNMKVDNRRLGDHPVFLKAMHKVGELLSEDVLESGRASAGKEQIKRTDGGMPILKSYQEMGKK
jgi:hypothetical protein